MTTEEEGPFTLEVRQADRADVFEDMVRVAHCYRRFSRAGRLIRVTCKQNHLLAVARGAPKNARGVIFLDQRGRQLLSVRIGETAEFTFEPACLFEEFMWAWNATDAMSRIAARLALLGLVLGLIGLFLGILTLFL